MPMMRAVANLTKDKGVYTEASMNPIMVDGTGMCGACRVTVGGEVSSLALTALILMRTRLILTKLSTGQKFIKSRKRLEMRTVTCSSKK